MLYQEIPCPSQDVLEGQNGSGASWGSWERFAGKSIQDFSTSRPFTGAVLANVESSGCGGDGSIESAAAPTAPPIDLTGNRTGELPMRRGAFSVRGTGEATGPEY